MTSAGPEPTDPERDARVAAVLVAVHTRLTEPPDDLVAARHLRAIRAATTTRRVGWRLAARTAAALAAVTATVLVLAGSDLLPDSAQRTIADGAQRIGFTLPRPPDLPPAPSPEDGAREAEHATETPPPAEGVPDVDGRKPAAGPPEPSSPPEPGPDRAPTRRGPDLDERPVPPRWDLDPAARPQSRRGAEVEHPDEPGPPSVTPPARVPTPTPGGERVPAPPSQPGSVGQRPNAPAADPPGQQRQRSGRAQDAQRPDRAPPQDGRGR